MTAHDRGRPGEERPRVSLDGDKSSIPRASDTRRRPRRWSVVIESRQCAFVSGWQTREELTKMRGRAPMWSSAAKAWCTTEDVARDLIARAERRGIAVDVESYVVLQPSKPAEPVVEQPDPGRGLW